LACGQADDFNRGVFFEELQHAIDNKMGRNPFPTPARNTLANAEFHKVVFIRMYENELFNITEAEFDELMKLVNNAINKFLTFCYSNLELAR